MLDSPEGVCAGQVGFEYPATSVPFSNCEGKHERSNRWCCTTAVLGLHWPCRCWWRRQVFQEPDSTCLFGSTWTLARRGIPGVVNLSTSARPLVPDSFGGH
jgi:hypothetical protein